MAAARLFSYSSTVFIYLLLCGCRQPSAPIEVTEAWSPATPPGAQVGAAYMHIEATSADTLIDASSPAAAKIEIHETLHEGDLAKMRRVGPVALAPGQPVAMQPGGMHFMLIGLTAPLETPSHFPITLHFEQAGEIEVQVDVVAAGNDRSHH